MLHRQVRHLAAAVLLLLPMLAPAASAQRAMTGESAITSLNGDWQFALASNPAEARQLADFHAPGFDASRFRALPVPANWAMHGFEEPLYAQHYKDNGRETLPIASEIRPASA